MKMKHFIAIFILFKSIEMIAQEPMVAYRKEGIWYYFDTNGKSTWKPYADVASFPNGWCNGLLKAAAMIITSDKAANIDVQRKQVLYDKKGKIVFQPKYDSLYKIVTGFDRAGYIQLRELEEDKLILCDKEGHIKFKADTEYSHYLGDGVVEYIKNGENTEGDKIHVLWDVKANKVLSEVNCVGFLGSFNRDVVFSYSSNAKYGMVNRKGVELLPMAWNSDILQIDEDSIFIEKFACLKNEKTAKWHLFNKNGQSVLSDFNEPFTLKNGFFICQMTVEGTEKTKIFSLQDTQIKEIDEKYGSGTQITEGGIIACQNDESDVTLLDKNLKIIAVIKGVKDIRAVQNHFWIQSNKEGFYDSYDEKGKKIGSIQAEAIGIAAYNHVPFMQNGKWGLARGSGKIVVKPQFEFSTENVPNVENGFWCINVTLTEESHRFDFYNFEGKLAMSTTAEKDGWDYIIPQETVKYFYRMY
jgi:hypothetical protein